MLRDRAALRRRVAGLERRLRQDKPIDRGLGEISKAIKVSQSQFQKRLAQRPRVSYPAQLPVSERHAEIAEAIAAHPVVVVAGETGSGKTTQLPKICLDLGRGIAGTIGHTQPRRLAARSVAARIAEELGSTVGEAVGYKVRFNDRVRESSHIKLMTDGILLAEIQQDPRLEQYDTLIIDEAHERSLNIDFILGYLKRLLPQRPDLKIIITSATINTEAFSRFFDRAPVIEVSGRTYPVTIHYRPLQEADDERDRDLPQAVVDAVDELAGIDPLGDTLVFLSGEREIREVSEALRKHHMDDTEIIPLFSRLSAAEQDRVFKAHRGRRIVLSTNVAETSLTVPGIRFVVDGGTARISRYSHRTKVQRLPIEMIAQASANQRSGRCGRVSAGTCIRLYSEDDFNNRPVFSDPEILRTNLASVILQMGVMGLGEVEQFPFVDAPDGRYIRDGYRQLHELGAVDEQRRITSLGKKLARFPVDTRIARMLLAADREASLEEMLVIASALSIQDPRERPMEKQQAADQAHARFNDASSDFIALLKLWNYYHEKSRHLSKNKLRKLCRDEFLSFVRMREWHEVHGQLLGVAREMGLKPNQAAADYAAIHKALLTGLLGNIATKEERKRFLGARNVKLNIFPGSSQFAKPPKWVMAAELVETTKLYARMVAAIEPEWIEPLARHLIKRSWSDAHWEKRRNQVVAQERVTLYGLPIVNRRKVNYGPIDPPQARALFMRHALVEGEYAGKAEFLRNNQKLLAEIEQEEAKLRRRDRLVDEQVLFEFYDQRIPAGVYDGRGFESWRKEQETKQPRLLFMSRADLLQESSQKLDSAQYPEFIVCDEIKIALSYHFEPGAEDDGGSAMISLPLVDRIHEACFEWLVPGLLEEKLVALIKTLPKPLRRNFVPAVNFVRACLPNLTPYSSELMSSFRRELLRMTGVEIPADAWQLEKLPTHLRMNFRIVDDRGRDQIQGRDLAQIRQRLAGKLKGHLKSPPSPDKNSEKEQNTIERSGITVWDFGELPDKLLVNRKGISFTAYPALVDEQDSVAIRLFETQDLAREMMQQGLCRLFMLQSRDKFKYLRGKLPHLKQMCLYYAPIGQCDELIDGLLLKVAQQSFLDGHRWPRTADAFQQQLDAGRARVIELANTLAESIYAVLLQMHAIKKQLAGAAKPHRLVAYQDIQQQLEQLIYPGFILATPEKILRQYPRYLKAIELRLDKLDASVERDGRHIREIEALKRAYEKLLGKTNKPYPEAVVEFRWQLEELRISLFAQEVKTLQPVSVKRLQKMLQQL